MVDFNVVLAHRRLMQRQREDIDHFRFKHNPPGVRYFELYSETSHERRWTTSLQGDLFHTPPGWVEAEVTHAECVHRRDGWLREHDDDEL